MHKPDEITIEMTPSEEVATTDKEAPKLSGVASFKVELSDSTEIDFYVNKLLDIHDLKEGVTSTKECISLHGYVYSPSVGIELRTTTLKRIAEKGLSLSADLYSLIPEIADADNGILRGNVSKWLEANKNGLEIEKVIVALNRISKNRLYDLIDELKFFDLDTEGVDERISEIVKGLSILEELK